MQKPGRAQWLPDTRPEPYLLGLKPHFTMCTLCSLSSSQPNKLRHILIFVSWYPIQHIFVPACSIAWNRHCVYLQLPNFVSHQCIDTGLFWIQGYRTEKCTHCTLYSFWFSLCTYFCPTFCSGAPPPDSSFVVSVLDNLPEKVFTCCQRKNFQEYFLAKIVFLDSSILNLFKSYHKPANQKARKDWHLISPLHCSEALRCSWSWWLCRIHTLNCKNSTSSKRTLGSQSLGNIANELNSNIFFGQSWWLILRVASGDRSNWDKGLGGPTSICDTFLSLFTTQSFVLIFQRLRHSSRPKVEKKWAE